MAAQYKSNRRSRYIRVCGTSGSLSRGYFTSLYVEVASRLPGKFVLPLGLEICLLSDIVGKRYWRVIDVAILVLNEELREMVREKRRKHCTITFNFIVVIGMSDIPKTLRFLMHIQKLDTILTTPLAHHFQLNRNAKQARKRGTGARTLTLAAEWASRQLM